MAVLGGGVSGANKMGAGGWKPCLYLCSVNLTFSTCTVLLALFPGSPHVGMKTAFPYCKLLQHLTSSLVPRLSWKLGGAWEGGYCDAYW